MDIQIVAQNFDITDGLKMHVSDKIGPLQKRFPRITQIRVSMHVDNIDQIAEGNIHIDGTEIHAAATTSDMYASIDQMVEKLTGQMTKHKEKIIGHHHQ